MKAIDINQALQQIHQLLENASLGAEIMITKNDLPMVKLVSPYPQQKRPPLFGSDKGKISITDDFDEPLEDFKDY
ncbi:type II toxin-antitoxin system Phd/YefM family antitoxin [Coleofasciculus sp.]|jgi:antitoxin (DNA-binding transcriptional repressor) of toxin-antitoxin stability system|uniref:type II toxin-antitoxin system Phd/YefM family antitoxin n=1 Tax=Coleofasciculus sp. TaxID=3100458 RepID=UPI003A3E4617